MAGPLPQAQKGALDILKDVADAHLKEASRLNKEKLVIGGCACIRMHAHVCVMEVASAWTHLGVTSRLRANGGVLAP